MDIIPLEPPTSTEIISNTTNRVMPAKYSKHAPKYTGKTKELTEYFEDFEDATEEVGLTSDSAEKIFWVVKYVRNRDAATF